MGNSINERKSRIVLGVEYNYLRGCQKIATFPHPMRGQCRSAQAIPWNPSHTPLPHMIPQLARKRSKHLLWEQSNKQVTHECHSAQMPKKCGLNIHWQCYENCMPVYAHKYGYTYNEDKHCAVWKNNGCLDKEEQNAQQQGSAWPLKTYIDWDQEIHAPTCT